MRNHQVYNNTENQRAGNRCQRNHLEEGKRQTADTGNENYRNGKEIAVIIQIHALNHFQTAYSDKAVKCYTNTAHNAIRNAGKEGNKGRRMK